MAVVAQARVQRSKKTQPLIVRIIHWVNAVAIDMTAKYVGFKCIDGYSGSIDMASALHAQTQLTTKYAGEVIHKDFGFPLRLRVATKLGFKSPKQIVAMEVTNRYPGRYWEDRR